MKKLFLAVCATLVGTVAFAQASGGFVGGTVGFNYGNSRVDTVKTKTTSLSINPEVGWFFSESLAMGLRVGIGTESTNDPQGLEKYGNGIQNSFLFSINPYVRARLLELGKLGVWMEGGLYGNVDVASSEKTDYKETTTQYGLNVKPVLMYPISNNITLECGVNFLDLHVGGKAVKTTTKRNDEEYTNKSNDFDFGLSATTKDILSLCDVSIGFIYRF